MLKSGEILVESTDESAYFRVLLFVRQESARGWYILSRCRQGAQVTSPNSGSVSGRETLYYEATFDKQCLCRVIVWRRFSKRHMVILSMMIFAQRF